MPGAPISPQRRGAIRQAAKTMSYRKVALKFKCSVGTVARYCSLAKLPTPPRPQTPLKRKRGRPKKLTGRDMAHTQRLILANRRHTLLDILRQLRNLSIDISLSTLQRTMAKLELRRCVAVVKPVLDARACGLRRQYAILHATDDLDLWKRTIYVDEVAICTGGAKRIYVTRRSHERFHPDCLVPRFQSGRVSVMFWGAIWFGGRSKLIAFDLTESKGKKGGVTAEIYRDQITKGELWRCWKRVSANWRGYGTPRILEDNVKVHTSTTNRDIAEQQHFQYINHPPYSPDLNPIENCWHMLKQAVCNLPQ